MGQGSIPRYAMICSMMLDILLATPPPPPPPPPRNSAESGELGPAWQAAMETSEAMADMGPWA